MGKVSLGVAPGQVVVVADVGRGIAEDVDRRNVGRRHRRQQSREEEDKVVTPKGRNDSRGGIHLLAE